MVCDIHTEGHIDRETADALRLYFWDGVLVDLTYRLLEPVFLGFVSGNMGRKQSRRDTNFIG
jgi:hypothetical protein